MKKVALLAACALLVCGQAGGVELFVDSDPLGAAVAVNGEEAGRTPLRLANHPGGSLSLELSKYQYVTLVSERDTGEARRAQLFFTLSPENLSLRLEQAAQDVYINRAFTGRTPLSIKNLPPGTYEIEKSERGISFANTTYRNLRRASRLETLFSAGLFSASLAGTLAFSGGGGSEESRALGVSTAVFGGILAYNALKLLKLNVDERTAIKRMSVIEVEPFDQKGSVEFFSEGMEAVGRESWEEALSRFLYVINAYQDSQVVPFSVYEAGICHLKMRDPAEAERFFRTFVYEYPTYELFPYGAYHLLSTMLDSGNAPGALEDYRAIRPVRIEDASGTLCRDYYGLLERLYLETGRAEPVILEDLLEELDFFLSSYPSSAAAAEVSLLKGKLLYLYLDRGKGEALLRDIGQRYRSDGFIRSEVEKVLGNVR